MDQDNKTEIENNNKQIKSEWLAEEFFICHACESLAIRLRSIAQNKEGNKLIINMTCEKCLEPQDYIISFTGFNSIKLHEGKEENKN